MNQVVASPPVRVPDIALPDLHDDNPSFPDDDDEGLFDWDEVLRGIQSDSDEEDGISTAQETGAGSGTRTHTLD